MRKMTPVVEIGLPELDEEQVSLLAEECEQEITKHVLNIISAKSIENLSVVCIIEISDQLDASLEIDIAQQYDTGHNLDNLIEEATQHGYDWLEERLRGLATNYTKPGHS